MPLCKTLCCFLEKQLSVEDHDNEFSKWLAADFRYSACAELIKVAVRSDRMLIAALLSLFRTSLVYVSQVTYSSSH